MNGRKLLLITLAALMVGLAIEALKGFGDMKLNDGRQLSGADLRQLDTRPFLRQTDKDSLHLTARKAKVSGFQLSGLPGQGSVIGNSDDLEKSKARGETKTDKKKKKKKKKKKAKKKDPTAESITEVYEESKKKKSTDNEAAPTVGGVAGQVANTPKDPNNNEILNEWLNKLLARPDRDLTMEFVREFQSGNIPIDTFYAVLMSFLSETNSEFHSLAVLAAGNTPSPRSFDLLTQIALSENFDQGATTQALAEIRDYEFLQLLWIPQNILTSRGTTSANVELLEIVANTINQSTLRYLNGTLNTGEGTAPRYLSQARRIFQGLVPVIEKALEQFQSQPTVTSPLETALSRIRNANLVAVNDNI